MADVPSSVVDLVERFDRQVDAYRRGALNETQVRVEFIDVLSVALGWDVRNEAGYAEADKDVVHEGAIKEGAPDYCFRVGGTRKFFLDPCLTRRSAQGEVRTCPNHGPPPHHRDGPGDRPGGV
jgi:hypothetical protein